MTPVRRSRGERFHALVDTEGLPLRAVVHSAGIQDRDGAGLVLDKIRKALVQISLAGETESRRQHWIRQRAPRSKSQARFCPSLEASLTRTGLS